jgi:hypothetical protein
MWHRGAHSPNNATDPDPCNFILKHLPQYKVSCSQIVLSLVLYRKWIRDTNLLQDIGRLVVRSNLQQAPAKWSKVGSRKRGCQFNFNLERRLKPHWVFALLIWLDLWTNCSRTIVVPDDSESQSSKLERSSPNTIKTSFNTLWIPFHETWGRYAWVSLDHCAFFKAFQSKKDGGRDMWHMTYVDMSREAGFTVLPETMINKSWGNIQLEAQEPYIKLAHSFNS